MKHLLASVSLLLLLSFGSTPALAKSKPAPPPAEPIVVPEPPKPETTGTFMDAAGGAHSWRITRDHALEWDGQAYLPVGGAFTPRYWTGEQRDADWQADVKALETLAAHHVRDLYLYAGDKGLTHVPPAAMQRILDYLEGHGFRYGIEIADFPKDPLAGYVIKPAVYRDPAPTTTTQFRHIAGLVDAFYMLVSATDGDVIESGPAQIIGSDTAQTQIKASAEDRVLLLYPQRVFLDGSPESHLPNLWQDYDEYRDRLLGFFSHVKLGPGFRFFLDPLTDKIGFNGEVSNLIPQTDGFRLDFQAWLNKKYDHNVDDLNRGWGVEARDLPDFETASRCIPLWFQSKGVPALYDTEKKARYEVINRPSIGGHYWDDLAQFRLESTRGYMNAIADALKKGVADVPVVYKWSGRAPLFTNDDTTSGYDGLGMEAYGHGRALATQSGAYTFAQAEETPKTTWLIVSGTGESVGAASDAGRGFTSKAALFDDWDYLTDIGARGVFTAAFVGRENDAPDQLGWLGSYAASLEASSRRLIEPRTLWYPASLNGLDIGARALPGGVWWLPRFAPANLLLLGPDLRGYSLTDAEGRLPTSVVWSPHGALAEAKFAWGKDARPVVTDAAGIPVKISQKGVVWTVPVSANPIVIRSVKTMPLPLNAAEASAREAARLLKLAESQKISTQLYKDQLFYALNSIPDIPDNVDVRYGLLQRVIGELTEALRPYAWIEGEHAANYTFDALVPDPDASDGAYLSLDTDRDPPPPEDGGDRAYRAQYKFTVNAPGRYALWMASSPLNTANASPFSYRLDDGAANPVKGAAAEGAPYAGKFVWSNLGGATLERGLHTLTISVASRRSSDDHYALDIDALCITRAPFTPDGTNLPPIDIPPSDINSPVPSKGKK